MKSKTYNAKSWLQAVSLSMAILCMASIALWQPAMAKENPPHAAAELGEVNINDGFSELVKAVKPAVVNISVSMRQKGVPRLGNSQQDMEQLEEFLRRFFGELPPGFGIPSPENDASPRGPERRSMAVGSGFIISADGLVVTNNHVIEDADEIEVVFNDGRRIPAKLRGTDPKTDLALLEMESSSQFPYVQFGDSDEAHIGDWVIAIGNPFGLGGTTTSGIISARGRDIQFGPLDDYIQIDAPINQGNSGGPLFNTRGEVIGVNSAIFSPNGGNVGIAFAIPSSMANSVIAQLRDTGTVKRGFLGVRIQTVDEDIASSFGLPSPKGALVTDIVTESPAKNAGLQTGDIILEFNGEDVKKMRDLPKLVAKVTNEKEVDIVIWRNQKEKTLKTKVGLNEEDSEQKIDLGQTNKDDEQFGIIVEGLTEENRRRYAIDEKVSGVVITEVTRGGLGSRYGLRPGDVISRLGSTNITSPAELKDAIASNEREVIALLINRGGQVRFIAIPLTKEEN